MQADPNTSNSPPIRKMAAIMFTDIVGYTKMMGQNEKGTLKMLRKSRQLQLSMIKKHTGTCIKEMGDGMLARFEKAEHAVLCASDIQTEARSLAAKIRIGLHQGAITIENNDVFGNGVNIASRLQSVADPGGIFISDSIYDQVKDNDDIRTLKIGGIFLKNVKEPVLTYSIVGEELPETPRDRIKELTGSKTIDSIAVLPFDNLSGDAEQQFFVDGMQDALITELSQISALRVISRTSTLRYRNTDKTAPEIARELGVDALVEASIFKHEQMVRIQAQLIKAVPIEEHFWASSYDREIKNVFAMYNEVVKDITRQIGARLTEEEAIHLEQSYEVNPNAYEAYLKAMFYWEKLKGEDLDLALQYFDQSSKLDPRFAPAYSGMAGVWLGRAQMGLVPHSEAIPNVYSNLYRSMDLDDTLADSHYWRAGLHVWMDWDWEKGHQSYRKALSNNPNLAIGRAYYAHLLAIVGKLDEAIEQSELAIELDPFNILFKSLYAMVLNYARRYEQARDLLLNLLLEDKSHPIVLSTLRTVYHNLGEFDKAYEAFRKSYIEKRQTDLAIILDEAYEKGGYQHALVSVAEAKINGNPDKYSTPWQIATLFTRAGSHQKAVAYLNKAYEVKDPNMPYVAIDPIFDTLRAEQGYVELLEKMKLKDVYIKTEVL